MDIGKSIRVACAINDMKAKDLSNKTGLSEPTISQYRTGLREPSIGALRAMAKALSMKVSVFIALGE